MFNISSIINVLKKVDSAIDTGVNKYTSACDTAERKVMNKLTKKDIMIDDALDSGCTQVHALVQDVIPFVKTTACTVKHTVCDKVTVLKSKISTTQEEGVSPFDWKTQLACDKQLAAAINYMYMNTMIQVHTTLITPTLGTKPIIVDGSAPVAKIINNNSASQAGIIMCMPTPVRTPVLYRMRNYVLNVLNKTPMCKCTASN
jgi:hypothetical protein